MNTDDKPRCGDLGGRNKDGTPCRRYPRPGRERCKRHGGNTPRGMRHHAFKHGDYAKDALPPRLREDYERAMADPDLMSLRREISVYKSRSVELFKRLSTGEAGAAWRQVNNMLKELYRAIEQNDMVTVATLEAGLKEVTKLAKQDENIWVQIFDAFEMIRRLTDAERKRLMDLQQTLTIENANNLLAMVYETIAEEVRDPMTKVRIASKLRQRVLERGRARIGRPPDVSHLQPAGREVGNGSAP